MRKIVLVTVMGFILKEDNLQHKRDSDKMTFVS